MPTASKPLSSAEKTVAGSLLSATLLAFTGGSLDAFIYLNHGHVFAAAMTGNGVLLGVSILHHDWMQALRHLLPVFGFVIGVFAAKALDGTLKQHAVTVGLGCEIIALFAASWLPKGFPEMAFVPMIAIVAAYQVASFRRADEYSYNSTFITGNLRTAIDGLYDASDPAKREDGLRKTRAMLSIVAGFLVGAAVGATLAPRLKNHTLWVVDIPLLVVLAMVIVRQRSNKRVA